MKVGIYQKVSELMQGISNARPPQPKDTFTWDVQTVLKFIKENWGNNREIIDKELSLKLAMLRALTTASRAMETHHLNIENMGRLNPVCFRI